MFNATVDRLFFAILPPIALARRIVGEMAWLDARLLAAARLHVTMFILDDLSGVDTGVLTALAGVGDTVRAAPIAVTLDRLIASTRSIALRPDGSNGALVALHAELARLARHAGIAERHGYRFAPHLTLGYRDGASFGRRVAPITWRAEELVLIHSHVGLTRHDVVGRWPLHGRPDPQLSLL